MTNRAPAALALRPVVAPAPLALVEAAESAKGYAANARSENTRKAYRAAWQAYDATALVEAGKRQSHILVDQGLADKFLERELRSEIFEAACKAHGQELTVRRHAGYDHGYFFVSTFVEDHLRRHRAVL